jgi:hypothetical protein
VPLRQPVLAGATRRSRRRWWFGIRAGQVDQSVEQQLVLPEQVFPDLVQVVSVQLERVAQRLGQQPGERSGDGISHRRTDVDRTPVAVSGADVG